MSQEFKEKVAGYSDEQIATVLRNRGEYSAESIRIVEEEAGLRGGLDQLLERVNSAIARRKRLRDLLPSINQEFTSGEQPEKIIHWLASQGLEGEDVDAMVHAAYEQHRQHIDEQTDTQRSAFRTILGGVVACVVGGFYLSFFVLGVRRVVVVFAFGFFLLSFGIVRLISGGKRTPFVIGVTVGAMVFAAAIGLWLYQHGITIPAADAP